MKDVFDQGLAASKDFAAKAGAKAQDLGERGKLMLDIRQLDYQAEKLIAKLGNEAYKAFAENGRETLSSDEEAIKEILEKIAEIKDKIDVKEAELSIKKAN
jgi:predicted Fe-Mo cluster-binding NifX family protein